MAVSNEFTWADYLVFAATIVLSLAIGVYYAFTGGRQKTTSEYLVADRTLHFLPVSLSMSVSYLSSIAILGNSSEMHYYGATYMFYAVGMAIGIVLAAFFAVPVFYPLQLTSVNQFLLLRYESRSVHILGWLCQVVSAVIYTGLVVFGPAVMFQAMSGFPVWASMLLMGATSTVYTTMGGLKAVIWTDVLQSVIIFAGLLTVVIRGVILCGGMDNVWAVYDDGYRLTINAEFSPMARMTVWSIMLTAIWHSYSSTGCSQPGVQRVAAVTSMRDAKIAVLGTIPVRLMLECLSMLCGVITFAYYASSGCDPLEAGYTTNANQALPYFVMEALYFPGVPGLFVACVFCGALSNLSSAINGATALTWEDLLTDRLDHWPERRKIICNKMLSVFFGAASTGVGFLLSMVGGTLMQINVVSLSVSICPLLLLFITGSLVPRVNWRSAMTGSVLSMLLAIWISAGAMFFKSHQDHLPTTAENCTSTINGTVWLTSTESSVFTTEYTHVNRTYVEESSGFGRFFQLSPFLQTPLIVIISMIFTVLISFIPGCYTTGKKKPHLYFPCIRRMVGDGADDRAEEYTMVSTRPMS